MPNYTFYPYRYQHDSQKATDIMKTYRVWQEEDKASGLGKWHVESSGSQAELSSKDLHEAPSYSLVFVLDTAKERLLLGLKRRAFAAGLYNGFGGKPDKDEDMLTCARRELEEESGLKVSAAEMSHAGDMYLSRPKPTPTGKDSQPLDARSVDLIRICVYTCTEWEGEPIETEEMTPKWFSTKANPSTGDEPPIPWFQMWPESWVYLRPVMDGAFNGTDYVPEDYLFEYLCDVFTLGDQHIRLDKVFRRQTYAVAPVSAS